MKPITIISSLLILIWGSVSAPASIFIFDDVSATSPSGRYLVEAKTLENAGLKPGERRSIKQTFVYTCYDTQEKKLLWTRKQGYVPPKSDPQAPPAKPLAAGEPRLISIFRPCYIYVSDSGWSAIREFEGELTCIDRAGADSPRIRMIDDALTPTEQSDYVLKTGTGHRRWEDCSIWYFLNVDQAQLFVVRPWWGRRIVADITTGRVIPETTAIATAAEPYEKAHVLHMLQRATSKQTTDERARYLDSKEGAYLAGSLKLNEAVPFLRELEKSNHLYINDLDYRPQNPDDEIQPRTTKYNYYTFRRMAQLSLRRLGERPGPLPAYRFWISKTGKLEEFSLPPLQTPRHLAADKIEKEMGTKDVLPLIGSPDLVRDEVWHYDMDAKQPYTLVLTWEGTRLAKIERISPPMWKSGLTRELFFVR